ncbi:stromal-processing peptidase, putative [Plasmodium gallinaceum]|uniref:Stromal-processing peptidase, putative n=1 Tax=Plasmodium gallinaceum TaxID=5849 RepID=A0A1J1GQ08_PLAGA|nr:stromal-processing peptidase, putative [Plasmodium gallinaceum]CRG94597.1 stromal-processing peptidase, putative [Plasmodium gallinaceum]
MNSLVLIFICVHNLVYCLNRNIRKNAYILYSPKSANSIKPTSRRWSKPLNNNMNELHEDEDLIKFKLSNSLNSIIYKKRKNVNKKKFILNNENHVILPSHKISDEYKKCINPIDYNYEELHVYMEVNTGSVNEKKNQQGISHLCEHVSYMGSQNRKNIIDKNIRTNAYTDFHHIVFYISVSLNNDIYKENSFANFNHDNFIKNIREEEIENYDIYSVDEFNYKHSILSQCIDTMVEVLKGETQFNKERIKKEKKAIFSEYSIINTVEYKMNSDIIKTLHKENRLSHRLPIGKLELLKRYEEKDLKEYFDLFFRSENVNLYVYGDVNVDITQKLIKKKFESIKNKILSFEDIKYLNILNNNTLRSKNKNFPAVVHNFNNNIEKNYMKKDFHEANNTSVNTCNDNIINEHNSNISEYFTDDDFVDNRYIDDNIIDVEKLKEIKKNENEIMSELKFRSYLKNKYAVNIEEEKLLNKTELKNIITDFEIIKYSLSNVNINILLKEEIKSIRTFEDFKISVIKEIIFYCLSFRFNIHRNDLFNSIDINEYTNINEGATIRTIEIKTTTKSFEKTINVFYSFIKSLLLYGFSRDEILNYKLNEIDYDEEEENKQHISKNMKLTHPEKCDDEYILDTKINETYTDEIQKIIDYNSCNHVYMNEKREKKLKKEIFDQLKIEEINTFAKYYFQYLFNIFNKNTNFKPHCVVVHVPHNNINEFNKNKIKKLFFDNIYSKEVVPNFSINIQKKLLSSEYIFENITQNIHLAKYIEPNSNSNIDIFHYIIKKINQIKKDNVPIYNPYSLSTTPNFNLFKNFYDINVEDKNNNEIDKREKEKNVNEFMKIENNQDNKYNEDLGELKNELNNNTLPSINDKILNDKIDFPSLKSHILSKKNQKDVENYELTNGIKVNLYKTKIDKKNIYLRLIIPYNKILQKKKQNVFVLLFSIICLFEGGEIENVCRENVEVHCSNKNINIYIDVNDEYFFIDIYTYNKNENINSAFSIINNILLQTKIENSSLQRVIDKLKKDFFEYKNNLQSFLIGQTISYLSDGYIGYQNFDLDTVENISLEVVQKELLNLFSDLSLFEITIVGNISDFIHYYILHFLGTIKKKREKKNDNINDNDHKEVNSSKNIKIKDYIMNKNILSNHRDKENELLNEYNLLCPIKNFDKKSKEITYVYLNEKEEHGVFLLAGKSANSYGFLSNGIHISFYLLYFLKELVLRSNKSENKENIFDRELEKIKSHINSNEYKEENLKDLIKKKKKLYTNPLFFSIVSYIIQYVLNSKLFHYLREKKELTYDSSFEFLNYEKYFTGFFTLIVQTNPKDLELIKKEVLFCFEDFTKNYYNYSDYLIENAKLSYLNKKNKDLKYFIDKISGMQLTHFPLKYKNKYILKDNLILNKIEKVDILLVLFVLFNQTNNYHISYGISAPEDIWKNNYKNINNL